MCGLSTAFHFEQKVQRPDGTQGKLIRLLEFPPPPCYLGTSTTRVYGHLRHDENLCRPSLESRRFGSRRRLWGHRHEPALCFSSGAKCIPGDTGGFSRCCLSYYLEPSCYRYVQIRPSRHARGLQG